MAHGRSQVVQPQLAHQGADAAFGEPALIAAAVGVFDEVHVPGIGVAVGGLQRGGGLHGGNILAGELALSALAAEPFHGLCHHGFGVVVRQALHIRALGHGEDERAQHGTAHDVRLEAVALFKGGELGDELFVFWLGLFRNAFGFVRVIAEHRRELRLERADEQRPHGLGHSRVCHFAAPPNWIFTICIFMRSSPTRARKRKKPLTDGSFRSW